MPRTFYMVSELHNNLTSQNMTEISAPADAQIGTIGWVVGGTAANRYSDFLANSEQAPGTFSTTLKPDTTVFDSNQGPLTDVPITGLITPAQGAWTFNAALARGSGGGNSADGAIRARIYAASAADLSARRELTAATIQGTTITNLAGATQTSVVSFTPATNITLQNEYIFVQLAWRVTGAASAGNDINFRSTTSLVIPDPAPLVVPTGGDLVGMVCG